jgi:hypothetical protein
VLVRWNELDPGFFERRLDLPESLCSPPDLWGGFNSLDGGKANFSKFRKLRLANSQQASGCLDL